MSWQAMTENKVFRVVFDTQVYLSGMLPYGVRRLIKPQMAVYVRYLNGVWYTGRSEDDFEFSTACTIPGSGEDDRRICVLGLFLTYDPESGFLSLMKDDLLQSNVLYPGLAMLMDKSDLSLLMAHLERPESRIFTQDEVIGYRPCNVKWSNAMSFDPSSDAEGKCLQFAASSKGSVFVIFSAIPDDKNTWYYVLISPYGVGIFKVCSTFNLLAIFSLSLIYMCFFKIPT